MRLEKSIDVRQPVERVFAYVTSTEHFPEWASAIVEVRQTSPGPAGQDATYAIVAKFLGRRIETATRVTAYEPPRRVVYATTFGPLPAEATWTLEPRPDGTRLTYSVEADEAAARRLFKLAQPLLVAAARRQWTSDLETLKDLLESRG